MKNILKIAFAFALLLGAACKKALDYTPRGAVSSSDLTSPTAVEGLVTAAYAAIGNGDMIGRFTANGHLAQSVQTIHTKVVAAQVTWVKLMQWSITTWLPLPLMHLYHAPGKTFSNLFQEPMLRCVL